MLSKYLPKLSQLFANNILKKKKKKNTAVKAIGLPIS